jgi:hypothetical protein
MWEGPRGGRSYWSKYRAIKRRVRQHVRDLQEISDHSAQEENLTVNTANGDLHIQRHFTYNHNSNSKSTVPVENSENTNSPNQCDTDSSTMGRDVCEIYDTSKGSEEDIYDNPMEAAEVLTVDSGTEDEPEFTENK